MDDDPVLGILAGLTYGPYQELRGLLGMMSGRQKAELAADLTPGVGDVKALAYDLPRDLRDRNYGWAAINALSAIPVAGVLGDAARMGRKLPMDEASRMARADEMFPIEAYHGTTQNFDAFGDGLLSRESHHGAAHYFSSSPRDVELNYARADGPDLVGRIEREAERIAEYEDDAMEAALQIARDRFVGHDGATIPARLRLQNPVDLRRGSETQFRYEWDLDDLGPEPDWDSPDYDAWQDALDELISSTEPGGSLQEIIRALRSVGSDTGLDVYDLIAHIDDHAIANDGIGARDLEKLIREDVSMMDAIDLDTDEWLGGPGEFLRRVYERAGYDGTVLDAQETFGPRMTKYGRIQGMGDSVEGATHYTVFNPNQVRSRFARFDPDRLESADLLAGMAGLLGLQAARQHNREF